jgi:hypothetical protein
MMCKSLSESPRFRRCFHGNGEDEGDIANELQFKNALKFIDFSDYPYPYRFPNEYFRVHNVRWHRLLMEE